MHSYKLNAINRSDVCGPIVANWLILHPSADTLANMEQRWNDTDRGQQKELEKNQSQYNLSTTSFKWTVLGAEPGPRSEKPVTNHLSSVIKLELLSCQVNY
jgi:hypothetical protein